VDVAEDGASALAMLRDGDARAMITDWEMPGLTGPELCRDVRKLDLGRYVYIIMLTSRNRHADLVEGLRAGADDFLSKPFDPVELSVRLAGAERVAKLETRDLMIFALAKLAESRDSETGTHLERVRSYCRLLAEEFFRQPPDDAVKTPDFVKLIYVTSPLHDIGKVGIPDAVLLKPGRLTPEEMEVIMTHAISKCSLFIFSPSIVLFKSSSGRKKSMTPSAMLVDSFSIFSFTAAI
jgi:putative two-component system response regulator